MNNPDYSDLRPSIKLYCRLRAPTSTELSVSENYPSPNQPPVNKDKSDTFQISSACQFSFICSKDSKSNYVAYLDDPIQGVNVNDTVLSEHDFNTVLDNYRHKLFQFDQVFNPFTSNAEIYQTTCEDAANHIFEDTNTTILVLGPHNVGKQYLLRGEEMKEKGMIMLCLEDILKKLEGFEPTIEQDIKLEVSIFGIYKGKPFDLLSSKLGEDFQSQKEGDASDRPGAWTYTKEKIAVASSFKHLSRKSLNNLKIYCNLFNSQSDTVVKDHIHLVFRIALTKYAMEKAQSVGVIDFVKLAPIHDIRDQTDISQLMRNLEAAVAFDNEALSFRQHDVLSDIVLNQKSEIKLVSVISPVDKTADVTLEALELCEQIKKMSHNNQSYQRQKTNPTPKKKEVAFAMEENIENKPRKLSNKSYAEDGMRRSTPEPEIQKNIGKASNRSSVKDTSSQASPLHPKMNRSNSVQGKTVEKSPVRRMPQREEPVFHPTYAVDENNYLLLTDYVQKLGKEIYYDLDQVLEKVENKQMELWEQIEFSLLSLKHRLRKRDELQNKLDLFSKEREIEILAEIQENRNKVYKLEETMKQNLYTSAPAEQRNPRDVEKPVRNLKVATTKVKPGMRSSSANTRLLEKTKSMTQAKKRPQEPIMSPQAKQREVNVREYEKEIEKQAKVVEILRNNNKMQTDILNNLKQKLQEVEVENGKLYHNSRNLEKVLESERHNVRTQEETIRGLEKKVASLQEAIQDYSAETARLKQALRAVPTNQSNRPNYVQAERPNKDKKSKEVYKDSDKMLTVRKQAASPKKSTSSKTAGFTKEALEIQRLKEELERAFDELDTEKQKFKEINDENVKLADRNADKMNLMTKVERNLQIIKENQDRQLREAEDRLLEFKDYIDTLKGENQTLLETQTLLAKKLQGSEKVIHGYDEKVKDLQNENKSLRLKMKKLNEKMTLLMEDNHLGSQGSSDLESGLEDVKLWFF